MHGDEASNRELVAGIIEGAPNAENVSLLVCPPYPYLASVADQLQGSGVELGAQNVSEHDSGAYTGEVATDMLRDVAGLADHLSGPLCDAVTGREDGQEMLERLDKANLFVIPLDGERQWYRYHHLFADLLGR